MNSNRELYVGMMSGTSVDGIDAVVASVGVNGTNLVASYDHPIPAQLRQQILSICTNQHTTIREVGLVDHKLGRLYASAVNQLLKQADLQPEQITAIGNHGQTVFHEPTGASPFTMQLGDANLIAALTGIDTIADFRRIDMAMGGQGAPLTPAFHQHLFKQRDSTTAIVNIGGIANITVIPAREQTNNQVTGFDTGPGNTLMDAWCEKHTGQKYDENGSWAQSGQTNDILLNQFMSDPYLQKPYPKSTGREHYNLQWLTRKIEKQQKDFLPAQDIQRTLCEFTALSITQQVQTFKHGKDSELLVCGGGASNPLLMKRIQLHLKDWVVVPTSARGIPGDYMEAMAFAWLAHQRVHNQPSSLPSVTGANSRASLGVFYPAVKVHSV